MTYRTQPPRPTQMQIRASLAALERMFSGIRRDKAARPEEEVAASENTSSKANLNRLFGSVKGGAA